MNHSKFRLPSVWMLTLLTVFLLTTGTVGRFGKPSSAAMMFNPDTIYALSTTNGLISFDSATPGTVSGPIPISGLIGGESIVGIDFRPATSELLGVASLLVEGLYVLVYASVMTRPQPRQPMLYAGGERSGSYPVGMNSMSNHAVQRPHAAPDA